MELLNFEQGPLWISRTLLVLHMGRAFNIERNAAEWATVAELCGVRSSKKPKTPCCCPMLLGLRAGLSEVFNIIEITVVNNNWK